MDRFGSYSWIVWYPVGGWGKWSTKELTTFFTQSGLKKNTRKEKSTGNSFALHSFLLLNSYFFSSFSSTVKPVYSDHPWDPQKVVVVQGWSLFGGRVSTNFCLLWKAGSLKTTESWQVELSFVSNNWALRARSLV